MQKCGKNYLGREDCKGPEAGAHLAENSKHAPVVGQRYCWGEWQKMRSERQSGLVLVKLYGL